MSEKPFGWRPFTQERREELLKEGRTPEQIDEDELLNVYSPVENAVWSTSLGIALLTAGAKHLGAEFAADVRASLERQAKRLSDSSDGEDAVEAPMVRRLIGAILWDDFINQDSGETGA